MYKSVPVFCALSLGIATADASNYTTVTIRSVKAPVVGYNVFYPVNNRCDQKGAEVPIAEFSVTSGDQFRTFDRVLRNPGSICFAIKHSEGEFATWAYSPVKRVELIMSDNKIDAYWKKNDEDRFEVTFTGEKTPVVTVHNAGDKSYKVQFYQPVVDANNFAKDCHTGYGEVASTLKTIGKGDTEDSMVVSPLYDANQNQQICLHVKAGLLVHTHGPFTISQGQNHFTILNHLSVQLDQTGAD